MNSNRARKGFTVVTAAATTVLVIAGCATEQEIRLAEPDLDFPYTSITAAPPPLSLDDLEDDEAEDEDEDKDADEDDADESETESSSSTTSTTRTTSSSRAPRSNSSDEDRGSNSGGGSRAAAPAAQAQRGSTCAWPDKAEANGKEYSIFCDREWARTVTPDEQQYFWVAKGSGWESIDPTGQRDNRECWSREAFNGAPDQVRSAVVFCD